jgi:predicted secreted protein
MANVFKNSVTGSIGTSNTKVYETPASTVSTVIGLNVSNVASNNISVDVTVTDSSATQTRHLIKNALIVEGSSIVIVGGEQKIVLEDGDSISVVSSAATSADVIVSVLEIS